MTFLVVLVIALAWVGAAFAWSRERFLASNSAGIGVSPFMSRARPPGPLAPPRTASMARRRRREVLATLALLALTTFVLAQAWSVMWAAHILVDAALIAYGWAVMAIERPDAVPARPRLEPVVQANREDQPRPGPRPETGEPEYGELFVG